MKRQPSFPPLAAIGLGIAGLVVAAALLGSGLGDLDNSWFRFCAAGIPWAAVLYGAVTREQRDGRALLQPLGALGDASYALYLWHIQVLAIVGIGVRHLRTGAPVPHAAALLFMLATAVTFALGIYRFAEVPMTSYVNRRLRVRSRPVILTAGPKPATP